jgi:hypothetical protein
MLTPPISAAGLRMPNDFEYEAYEAVYQRIAPHNERYPLRFPEWIGAWIGVAYRFHACAEYSEAFTRSIKKHGAAPRKPVERYRQERDLFGFFVNGLAAVENTCYALFTIASMMNPTSFPLIESDLPRETLEKKRKKNPGKNIDPRREINPKRTAKQFSEVFGEEPITNALVELVSNAVFEDWSNKRNIPSHRQSPPRDFQITVGDPHIDATWASDIPLNTSTTSERRKWLAETMRILLREADAFTAKYSPKLVD